MLRSEIIESTRVHMMLDNVTDPRDVVSHDRPMVRDLMIQTLNLNYPQWQKIVGLESEVEAIIVESYRKHKISE